MCWTVIDCSPFLVAVPVRTHANYQTTKFLPYIIKKYFLFQKGATLEPLYHFDTIAPGAAPAEEDLKARRAVEAYRVDGDSKQ